MKGGELYKIYNCRRQQSRDSLYIYATEKRPEQFCFEVQSVSDRSFQVGRALDYLVAPDDFLVATQIAGAFFGGFCDAYHDLPPFFVSEVSGKNVPMRFWRSLVSIPANCGEVMTPMMPSLSSNLIVAGCGRRSWTIVDAQADRFQTPLPLTPDLFRSGFRPSARIAGSGNPLLQPPAIVSASGASGTQKSRLIHRRP
jgi:hypothetical protein